MKLRQTLFIAACAIELTAANGVYAQSQPVQQPNQGQMPPCVQEFTKLREATDKRGQAIRQATQHKVSPQEACALFSAYAAAEEKMLKYAVDNGVWCGIPPSIIDNIKTGHAKSTEMRTRICRMAAMPARPAAPSLSDALSNPVPNSKNIKAGSGTFDTLTGLPLGK